MIEAQDNECWRNMKEADVDNKALVWLHVWVQLMHAVGRGLLFIWFELFTAIDLRKK